MTNARVWLQGDGPDSFLSSWGKLGGSKEVQEVDCPLAGAAEAADAGVFTGSPWSWEWVPQTLSMALVVRHLSAWVGTGAGSPVGRHRAPTG